MTGIDLKSIVYNCHVILKYLRGVANVFRKKRLDLQLSFYTILQIFNVTIFEQVNIIQVLTDINIETQMANTCNQLVLYDL